MRLSKLAMVTLGSLALFLLALPALAAEEEWEFDGGGWGHGVGLSQFGALGQAQEGRNASQILSHYYTGASVVQSPLPGDHWINQPEGLWVGLVPSTTGVSIQAVGDSVTICQPADCSDVNQSINPGESWRYEVNPNNTLECRFRHVGITHTGWKACGGEIRQDAATSVRIKVDGKDYAHGTVRLVPSPTGFHAVLKIGLEKYLYGLAEVPSSWHSEALKVQAIIGRSYAVATALARGGSNGSGKLSACGCHLRSTSADQVYAGWSKENPANGGNAWKAAVDSTDGQVLTHPEGPGTYKIISTFYSSSNGGASENSEDVWGGPPRAWLRSVPDKWSSNPSINPLARWTVVVPSSKIKSAFGWNTVTDVEVTSGPPGAVVKFTGLKGGSTVTTTRQGEALRLFLIANAYRRDGAQVRVSPYVISVRHTGGATARGIPITGDWNGDGVATPGRFHEGMWYLRLSNSTGAPQIVFQYGRKGDVPVVGDWNGNGQDTVGVYRGDTFFLLNRNESKAADHVVRFGKTGWIPVAGDWNGNGRDTPGVVSQYRWFLRNDLRGGPHQIRVDFGRPGWTPVPGDWNGDGRDTPAIVSQYRWFFRNDLRGGPHQWRVDFGRPDWDPVAGDWTGNGRDGIGSVAQSTWFQRNSASNGIVHNQFTYGTN